MINIPVWNRVLVAAICLLGVLYAMPNFFGAHVFEDVPEWLPGKQVNLGLDLQGGSHLLLQVESQAVTNERLESVLDAARDILRSNRVRYEALGIDGSAVGFRVTEPENIPLVTERLNAEFGTRFFDSMGRAGREVEVTSRPDGTFRLQMTSEAIENHIANAVQQSIEVVRRRIDELGTREPTIQREGRDRIIVQVPGLDDPERLKALIGQTAKLTFHLADQTNSLQAALEGRVPPGSMLLPSDDVGPAGVQSILVQRRVRVSGEHLVDAQATYQDNQPVVSFRFDSTGGRRFCQTTQENVGQPLAIVLDGRVISAPRINEAICGGSGIISGRFTVQQAQDLALLLRAGALPAPLTALEERSVGPGLGRDSVEAGKIAGILGIVFVIAYMAVSYGRFGLMANVALVVNIFLIMALLSVLQATLTLPGIAGIVLTIGMAVDANVLIFERIREEARAGRTPISAVDAGYRRAMTTIIDSNLTTLIGAVILFSLGAGPVRGFAITLSIGILTSMFTAIMVTRLLVVMWLRSRRPQALPI